jgi:hypothetical protein
MCETVPLNTGGLEVLPADKGRYRAPLASRVIALSRTLVLHGMFPALSGRAVHHLPGEEGGAEYDMNGNTVFRIRYILDLPDPDTKLFSSYPD